MGELSEITSVKTFSCKDFANGNVFWGHPEVFGAGEEPAGVQANWMVAKDLRRRCLHLAGLWALSSEHGTAKASLAAPLSTSNSSTRILTCAARRQDRRFRTRF